MDEGFMFEVVVPAERMRLVRLCARLSGDIDAAEDLAQETLLIAWRNAHKLQNQEQHWPWLATIARNVCLHWFRRHYRDHARLVTLNRRDELPFTHAGDDLPDNFDLEVELEREELATLLDRALALLPLETRSVLVERYIEESPHAEIAGRLGISESLVGVRLHRGKLALRRVLATNLREEAAAYGLTSGETDTWQETRIWCATCGQRRLLGMKSNTSLTLRCPNCCSEPGMNTAYDVSAERYRDIKGFRPAFSRLILHASAYYRNAIACGTARCPNCQCSLPLQPGLTPPLPMRLQHVPGIHVHCPTCGFSSDLTLDALASALPETQRFRRTYPRIRTLPVREVEVAGSAALITSFESLTGAARLDVISARDTFQLIDVHQSPAE